MKRLLASLLLLTGFAVSAACGATTNDAFVAASDGGSPAKGDGGTRDGGGTVTSDASDLTDASDAADASDGSDPIADEFGDAGAAGTCTKTAETPIPCPGSGYTKFDCSSVSDLPSGTLSMSTCERICPKRSALVGCSADSNRVLTCSYGCA